MSCKSILSNNRGLSIIEVVTTSGIMSIVMLAFSSLVSNQVQTTDFIQSRLDRNDLKVLLENTMAFTEACENSFKGIYPPNSKTDNPVSLTTITDRDGNHLVDIPGQQTSFGRIDVVAMQMENLETSLPTDGLANLKVSLAPKRKNQGGGTQGLTAIDYYFVANIVGGQIDSCGAATTGGPTGPTGPTDPTGPTGNGQSCDYGGQTYNDGELFTVTGPVVDNCGDGGTGSVTEYRCESGQLVQVSYTSGRSNRNGDCRGGGADEGDSHNAGQPH